MLLFCIISSMLLEMYKNASENSENYQGILLLDQKML